MKFDLALYPILKLRRQKHAKGLRKDVAASITRHHDEIMNNGGD